MDKLLFTSIFGSKLYGANTPTSDTDWKQIYLPDFVGLLRGVRLKNKPSSTGNDKSGNTEADIDLEMIPLQVLATDFLGGQSYALELVFHALQRSEDEESTVDPMFVDFCKKLSEEYLTSDVSSMLRFAVDQANKYGIKGTRLNELRQFDQMLKDAYTTDHMDEHSKLHDSVYFKTSTEAYDLEHIKNAMYNGPKSKHPEDRLDMSTIALGKVFGWEITFTEAIARTTKMLSKFGDRAKKAANDNGTEWKSMSHALRVADQVIDILSEHSLEFPLKHGNYYREVKLGMHSFESASLELEKRMLLVEKWKRDTKLPTSSPEHTEKFYKFLDKELLSFYGI